MERFDTLLIFSPSNENRVYLRASLKEGFNLLEAVTVQQLMLLLKQNKDCVAALLLDITSMNDEERKQFMQKEYVEQLHSVQVIVFTEDDDLVRLNRAFHLGAADVIPIDYEPYAMLRRIENVVQVRLHKRNLEELVAQQEEMLRQARASAVEAMSTVVEYRSKESGQHILRIRHFTRILLEEVVRCCPEYGLTEHDISIICSAASLHDIGKIAIPDAILLKPGKLTPEEAEIMRKHTVTGCEILNTLADATDQDYLRYAQNICRYHHERWDGKGYPNGLSKDEIPICAQVVGLTDAYDALTTKRIYKEAVPCSQAINMILNGECGAFSPKLLECFKHVTHLFEEQARDYTDGIQPQNEAQDIRLPVNKAALAENSAERIRGKYFALVHYVNGFLMELDLNKEIFHVVYNPYPDLAEFTEISTIDDLEERTLETVVHPSDRERMKWLLDEGIWDFVESGLRRKSYIFRFRSRLDPEGDLFEVTFLRISTTDVNRKTMAILARKVDAAGTPVPLNRPNGLADVIYSCQHDRDYTLIDVESGPNYLVGYSIAEIKEKLGGKMINLVHPQARDDIRNEMDAQLQRSSEAQVELHLQHKNGSSRWMLCKSRIVLDEAGNEYLYNAVTDITPFKRANIELYETLERYELILAQTENVLFEWDAKKDKLMLSNTWEQMFGVFPVMENLRENLINETQMHPDDMPLLFDAISAIDNGSHYEMVELRIANNKGRYLWYRIRMTAVRDKYGELEKIAGVIINIDADKRAEQILQSRAEQDSLTKLLNKEAARRQAEDYLARYANSAQCALILIDLDNFKQINDQNGHLFGDVVLTKVAQEIKKMFRNQDIVSRVGGDEFLVMMRGVANRQLLEGRCARLLEIFRNILQNQKQKLELSCSIGIAMSPEHGKTYYELFNKADQALYWAKSKGKNDFVFYNETDEMMDFQNRTVTTVNNRIDSDEEPGLAEDNLVRFAFRRLYGAKNVNDAVQDALKLIGQAMNVSRVYVLESSDDNRFFSNTYEWCNDGIEPAIQKLQNVSYEKEFVGSIQLFNEKGIFYCPDVNELPPHLCEAISKWGVKSVLQCAFYDGGVFRGCVGFDECVEQRYWTKEQIRTLTYFAEMLAVFLLKQRKQERTMRFALETQSILDNQDAWIYIVNPDTCQIKYANAKVKAMAPDLKPGMTCHKALMGLDERCAGCPALDIRQKKNGRKKVFSKSLNVETINEVALITWGGEDACLLTCREIPKDE